MRGIVDTTTTRKSPVVALDPAYAGREVAVAFEPPTGKRVELGGIEPPSVKGSPAAIRPFPV